MTTPIYKLTIQEGYSGDPETLMHGTYQDLLKEIWDCINMQFLVSAISIRAEWPEIIVYMEPVMAGHSGRLIIYALEEIGEDIVVFSTDV